MLLKNFSANDKSDEKTVSAEQRNTSNPSAKAAGAYARTAQYVPKVPDVTETDEEENISKSESDHPALSNSEIQAIHRLQSDVKKLRAKGVKVIMINKAGTFLESLQNAVKEAL